MGPLFYLLWRACSLGSLTKGTLTPTLQMKSEIPTHSEIQTESEICTKKCDRIKKFDGNKKCDGIKKCECECSFITKGWCPTKKMEKITQIWIISHQHEMKITYPANKYAVGSAKGSFPIEIAGKLGNCSKVEMTLMKWFVPHPPKINLRLFWTSWIWKILVQINQYEWYNGIVQ